jgi:hypothetical protein
MPYVMARAEFADRDVAEALLEVIGKSRWEAVALARAYLKVSGGGSEEEAAREMYEHGSQTLRKCREMLREARNKGLLTVLPPRERIGSAENAITKLFPATITEQRFAELLDGLCAARQPLSYADDRASGHGLTDFRLLEGELQLPINIKNAGTRFERAKQLVGLDPDDCIPIPAYKAHAALETVPNLLYVISVDYGLISELNRKLPELLSKPETTVWELLNKHSGTQLRNGEDAFVFAMVRKYWEELRTISVDNPFHVISARKAIRILQTKPHRTPGIGLRAWGTGASAEVNVHVSIHEDMTLWESIRDRITANGVTDVIQAVNRKRVEEVYDPEI